MPPSIRSRCRKKMKIVAHQVKTVGRQWVSPSTTSGGGAIARLDGSERAAPVAWFTSPDQADSVWECPRCRQKRPSYGSQYTVVAAPFAPELAVTKASSSGPVPVSNV